MALGDPKGRFQGEFGKTWIEKKNKLKYISFWLVHLNKTLLYLCRTTSNMGKNLQLQQLGTRRSLKQKAEREDVSKIDTIRFS